MHAALRTSLLLVVGALRLVAHAQPGDAPVADRAAILTVVQDETDAWNRGDAKAFSAHFAEDGSFTNVVGMHTYGRVPFQRQHERIFSTIYKGSHNVLSVERVKFVRPDVAIVDVESVLSGWTEMPPGLAAFPDGALHTKLEMVMSKVNGAWQIDAFHNVAVNPAVAAGPKPAGADGPPK